MIDRRREEGGGEGKAVVGGKGAEWESAYVTGAGGMTEASFEIDFRNGKQS